MPVPSASLPTKTRLLVDVDALAANETPPLDPGEDFMKFILKFAIARAKLKFHEICPVRNKNRDFKRKDSTDER